LSYANGGVVAPGDTTPRPGAQVFSGFTPSNGGRFDRHNFSFYSGLEGNLTGKFSAGIAARYENYSDFGTTTTGKVTARYAFSDAIALRGTASTGFHAPSLQQQFFQSTATNFIPTPTGLQPFDIFTFRVTDPAAIALGAEPLKAEKSTNYSLGLVLQPIDNLYITIDAYRIELKDRITLSESLTSTAVRDFLNSPAIGLVGVGGGRYFTNAIDTTTDGIDLIGTYKWELGSGRLDLTTGYNYNKTSIDRVATNPASLTAIDPTAERFGRVEIGRFEVGAPRDKFLLGGVWTSGNWEFSANGTRYGEITVRNPNPALDQTFDPKWTVDLAATFKLDSWDFTLGGDNVLNEYPDEILALNSRNGQVPYSSSAAPFGFNGAFVYGRIGYKW
ncbi:MAG: TonB-dependent receptor, partial [Pseudoxanthomonas sp.]